MGIMATGENNQDNHDTEYIKHFSNGMFELVKFDTKKKYIYAYRQTQVSTYYYSYCSMRDNNNI